MELGARLTSRARASPPPASIPHPRFQGLLGNVGRGSPLLVSRSPCTQTTTLEKGLGPLCTCTLTACPVCVSACIKEPLHMCKKNRSSQVNRGFREKKIGHSRTHARGRSPHSAQELNQEFTAAAGRRAAVTAWAEGCANALRGPGRQTPGRFSRLGISPHTSLETREAGSARLCWLRDHPGASRLSQC